MIDLDRYTHPTTMRALLQQRLPGFADGRLHIDTLAVHSVRRNASQQRRPSPMTVCWRLDVSDTQRARSGVQLLTAQVFRPGLSGQAFDMHRNRVLTQPDFGEPLVHLPDLHLLIWALPNDAALPQLPSLLNAAQQAAQRAPLQQGGATAQQLGVELVRYVPHERATLRYTVATGAQIGQEVIYAKTFAAERGADIHARFAWFWERAQHNTQAPLVAQPLAHDTFTVWQRSAPGAPLRHQLHHHDAPLLMASVADALATLHDAPLEPSPDTPAHTLEYWLRQARLRQHKLARVDPLLGQRVADIADTLETSADALGLRPAALIHGDCHHDQFWVHDGRIVMFDFDEFTHGDAMEDLAAFIVKLDQAGAPPALATALTQRYAQVAPARFSAFGLRWHLTIQSLLQASRAFIYQQPGWRDTAESRLHIAQGHAVQLHAADRSRAKPQPRATAPHEVHPQ